MDFVGLIPLGVAAGFAGWAVVAQVRGATARREWKTQEQTIRILDQERQILHLIAQGESLKQILDAITNAMERLMPECPCSIMLLDEDKLHLRVGSGGSLPREYMQALDGQGIGPRAGSCGIAAFKNETTVVKSIAQDARWASTKDLALSYGLEACWSAPICDANGTVRGTFALYHRKPVSPRPSELRLVEAAAHLAGNAIERFAGEKNFRDSAERIQIAQEAARFGVWEWAPASGKIALSALASAMVGLDGYAQTITMQEFAATLHPDDRAAANAAPEAARAKGATYENEVRRLLPDGSTHWYRLLGRVEREHGRPERLIGAIIDITQEKLLLDRLHEGAERFRLAEEAAHFGIWEMDVETGAIQFSEHAALMHGLPENVFVMNRFELRKMVHPEDREAFVSAVICALADGTGYDVEARLILPNGNLRWFRSQGRVELVNGKRSRVVGAVIDITQEKLLLNKLHESAERMRLAEEAAGFGIYEIDTQTSHMTISAGWAAMNGITPGTILDGRETNKFVHSEDRALVTAAMDKGFASGEPIQIEFRVVLPDGSIRWHRDRALVQHEVGKAPRVIGASIDITEQKEMMLSLKKAQVAAEAGALAKSEFLASMSHEIRTPMNGVIGMTGLLLDSPLTADQRECAETVCSSAEALLTIINGILDFSKIEAGKLEIGAFPFDLHLIVEEVIEMLSPKAEERHLQLILQYPTGVPTRFIGDADRIRQVITNLIGNAVKFTERGHVLVDIECADSSHGTAQMRVSVTDTGIGIPESKIGMLFDKFSQADSSITRRYGGTGLGLAICKQLVELMGGSIHLRSKEGQGSTFWFDLPLPVDTEPANHSVSELVLKGLRALIVEDIEVIRRVVQEQVSSCGIRNESCATAEEALAAIEAKHAERDPYDIVIGDYQLPGMDGATLAARIKADPRFSSVVFIMLSSICGWREAKGVESASVDACLVKPVRRAKLVRTLGETWSRKHAPNVASSPSLAVLQQNLAHQYAPSDVRVLVVEDNSVNQRVAVRLLRKLGACADVVGNGLEALELLKTHSYDFVFMDCQMPEMDGYETSAQIRLMTGANRNVRIIALTADAITGSRERCAEAGMDDFITKPVHFEDFVRVLQGRLVLQ